MAWETPQDHFTRVDGRRTRYWALGEGDPPLVLVHGFGGFAENWIENVHTLAEQRRVLVLDLPGHGQTEPDPGATYTPDFFADSVARFMDTLAVPRAHVAGHSLGGAIVLAFARRYGDRLERLIVAGSAGLSRQMPLPLRLMTIPLLGEFMVKPTRDGMRRLYASYSYDVATLPDELIETAYRYALSKPAQQVLLKALRQGVTLRGMRAEMVNGLVDSLPEIPHRTLVIWGREDQITPLESGVLLQERLPNATLEIIEHCGHLSMMEHPARFNQLAQDFLA